MKVREIMTTNVECVAPDTGVRELASKMKTLGMNELKLRKLTLPLGEGAKREPDRAKPQDRVRISRFE